MKTIKQFAVDIRKAGGRTFFVGGFVRDNFMGKKPTDIDLMISGVSFEDGISIMQKHSTIKVEPLIDHAPVFKVRFDGEVIEVAFARTEQSTGFKKGDFVFDCSGITPEQDMERRDFTINAMAQDVLTGEIIDPFGGQRDIQDKILRHVSDEFPKSPDRPERLAMFAARFPEFSLADETIAICKITPQAPIERVRDLMIKTFAKSAKPSRFFDVLSIIDREIPMVKAMKGVPQESEWHPEGDVFTHTMHVIDFMATKKASPLLMVAGLAHDMGKVSTTKIDGKRIVSPGHASAPEAKHFAEFMKFSGDEVDFIVTMTAMHMRHIVPVVNSKIVRRIIRDLKDHSIHDLAIVIEADHSGRPPLPQIMPASMAEILAVAEEMGTPKFERLVMGRHLIKLGLKPSPEFSKILAAAEEAQIEVFTTVEDGIRWVQEWMTQ